MRAPASCRNANPHAAVIPDMCRVTTHARSNIPRATDPLLTSPFQGRNPAAPLTQQRRTISQRWSLPLKGEARCGSSLHAPEHDYPRNSRELAHALFRTNRTPPRLYNFFRVFLITSVPHPPVLNRYCGHMNQRGYPLWLLRDWTAFFAFLIAFWAFIFAGFHAGRKVARGQTSQQRRTPIRSSSSTPMPKVPPRPRPLAPSLARLRLQREARPIRADARADKHPGTRRPLPRVQARDGQSRVACRRLHRRSPPPLQSEQSRQSAIRTPCAPRQSLRIARRRSCLPQSQRDWETRPVRRSSKSAGGRGSRVQRTRPAAPYSRLPIPHCLSAQRA